MVTGIEVAGLVLAILPLLASRVDDYVAGLVTIKSFGARRYRREMECIASRLGGEQAKLTDTMFQLMEDIVEVEDDIWDTPAEAWPGFAKNSAIEIKFRRRLGRSYDPFIAVMRSLCSNLQELDEKMGLKAEPGQDILLLESGVLVREVKRFRNVFSKPVYEDLLTKIGTANSLLESLIGSAIRRETATKRRNIQGAPFKHYRNVRKYARSVHKALSNEKAWKCIDKHHHIVSFRLEPDKASFLGGGPPDVRFQLALLSKDIAVQLESNEWLGHEIEIKSIEVQQPDEAVSIPKRTGISSRDKGKKRKVTFAMATMSLHSAASPAIPSIPGPEIKEICSALMAQVTPTHDYKCFGVLKEPSCAGHYHEVYFIKHLGTLPAPRSLHDSIASNNTNVGFLQTKPDSIVLWRNRLYIATVLATSVLKFQGSWLKTSWRSGDIILIDDPTSPGKRSAAKQLYLSCSAPFNSQQPVSKNPLIRSQVLFSLGLALVELAACRPLSSLRQPEDEDKNESTANLKTASRLLDAIFDQYGARYRGVVKGCLFWPGSEVDDLDDEDFQRAVFDTIVQPLMEDLSQFEGMSSSA